MFDNKIGALDLETHKIKSDNDNDNDTDNDNNNNNDNNNINIMNSSYTQDNFYHLGLVLKTNKFLLGLLTCICRHNKLYKLVMKGLENINK